MTEYQTSNLQPSKFLTNFEAEGKFSHLTKVSSTNKNSEETATTGANSAK